MRAILALLLSLLLAPAWAQVPMTGAGKGTPAAAVTFDVTYGSEGENATSQTSYSISSVSFGTGAGSNGYPVAAICMRSSNAITTPTVTINGNATTLVVEGITGAGPASYSGLFQSSTQLAPGSSVTVTIGSFGSAAARAAVSGYLVATTTSAVPSGGAVVALSISGVTLTGSVTVPSNGRSVLAGCSSGSSSSNITAPAADITQDVAKVIGASTTWVNSAHDTANRSGATTYTATYSGSTANSAGVVAAWAP